MNDTETRIDSRLWLDPYDFTETQEGTATNLEVERDDANRLSLHTFVNGRGSLLTFEFTREEAVDLARQLLNASRLR